MDIAHERAFCSAAMAWLNSRKAQGHVRFAFGELSGYVHDGSRIPLIDRQRGIRKPAAFKAALSIRTVYTPPGSGKPYDDRVPEDGLRRYKYQGDDPEHPENRALRAAYELKLPLIYFAGVASAVYEARYPVWILDDQPEILEFTLALPLS